MLGCLLGSLPDRDPVRTQAPVQGSGPQGRAGLQDGPWPLPHGAVASAPGGKRSGKMPRRRPCGTEVGAGASPSLPHRAVPTAAGSGRGHTFLGGTPQSCGGKPCPALPPERGGQWGWPWARFTGSAAATAAPASPELHVSREERGDRF